MNLSPKRDSSQLKALLAEASDPLLNTSKACVYTGETVYLWRKEECSEDLSGQLIRRTPQEPAGPVLCVQAE